MNSINNFIKYHSKITEVKLINYVEPISFILESFGEYSEISDIGGSNPFITYEAKIKLIDKEWYQEVSNKFIKYCIEKELNLRMKLFSINGECFVTI